MAKLVVTGFDPSLRNWGMAKGEFDTETKKLKLAYLDIIQPIAPTNKSVRQNSKDLECAKQLFVKSTEFHELIISSHMIFVEVPVSSQSARSALSVGLCLGVLGALQGLQYPILQITPLEVKLAATGRKTASKRDMINWAVNAHPEVDWPSRIVKGETRIIEGTAEHMADAVGAIYAGLKTPEFNNLVALYESKQ